MRRLFWFSLILLMILSFSTLNILSRKNVGDENILLPKKFSNDMYGFINQNGEVIIDSIYFSVRRINNSFFVVNI